MEAHPMQKTGRRLVPDAEVCRRYHIHISTLANWDKDPELGFPKALRINKRKFRDENELDAFDQARAAERDSSAA